MFNRIVFLSAATLFLVLNFSGIAKAGSCHPDAVCSHGLAIWGEPKYGPDFTHFEYTNPGAPKGGDVRYASIGEYNSLNKHILKGVQADGLGMLYDYLIVSSDDEPFTKYGLLAETIELAKDRSWVAFYLRKEARWHDEQPITADDVVFSFDVLIEKGHPYYQSYYREIAKVEALDTHHVKFTFENNTNRELPLIIGQIPILPKHYYDKVDFAKTTHEPPLGSGPYKIEALDPGKWIRYKRVEDYWAKDLPVNKGRYNFDTITYDYYRDATVAVEAFKAGEYDVREENTSKTWKTAYDFPAVHDGRVNKVELSHERPTGMQGFVFNTRREKFKDRFVRKALAYAFDFEWTNKNLFNGAYTRTKSYYSNSEFASSGLPEGQELEILKMFAFRDRTPGEPITSEENYRKLYKAYENGEMGQEPGFVPYEVFSEPYLVPTNDGSGTIRKNLLIARDLLKKAGWEVKEGVLTHRETGDVMVFEFLITQAAFERVVAPLVRNLKKLGIEATIRRVDPAQYIKRAEEFDFDILVTTFGQSLNPGNEQEDYWHSSRADIPGTRNLAGVRDPVVDALVEKIITATDKETLVASTRALDRVLLHGHYVIPNWHIRYFRVIYWDRFGQPEKRGKYLLNLDTWWVEPEKDAALQERVGG